jgi:YesN/AraC family two-component response regulator
MIHEAMEAGADDFILKPYNEEELITVLNNIINN